MLKVRSRHADPFWLDLDGVAPGVRVQVRPITVSAMIAARYSAAEAMDASAVEDRPAAVQEAVVRALARSGIVGWEGVGDADGNPLEPGPAAIDDFVSIWPVFQALDSLYVAPAVAVEQEKNASGLSPNGTSEGGPTTAAPVAPVAPAALT